jgi:hypothetical protein
MSYPTTPLKSFADVQNLLDAFLKTASFPIGGAPHGKFWRTNILTQKPMTWEEFTTGVLPLMPPYSTNFQNPPEDAGSPTIVVVTKAKESPLINMLSAAGPYWDAVGQYAGQMPQDSPPYDPNPPFDPPQALVIQLLTDWINAGCPNGRHALVLLPKEAGT